MSSVFNKITQKKVISFRNKHSLFFHHVVLLKRINAADIFLQTDEMTKRLEVRQMELKRALDRSERSKFVLRLNVFL